VKITALPRNTNLKKTAARIRNEQPRPENGLIIPHETSFRFLISINQIGRFHLSAGSESVCRHQRKPVFAFDRLPTSSCSSRAARRFPACYSRSMAADAEAHVNIEAGVRRTATNHASTRASAASADLDHKVEQPKGKPGPSPAAARRRPFQIAARLSPEGQAPSAPRIHKVVTGRHADK